MQFEYEIKTNIKIGQELWGIIAVTTSTYEGVFPIKVYDIDHNNREIIFEINQPCRYVSCNFAELKVYVFESQLEAEIQEGKLSFGEGMFAHYF